MQFNINFDEKKELTALEAIFRQNALSSAKNYINSLFADGKGYSGNKGAGYELIEKFIDDNFLEEKSKKIIDAFIESNWERILNEATEKALTHKANAIAFNKIKG